MICKPLERLTRNPEFDYDYYHPYILQGDEVIAQVEFQDNNWVIHGIHKFGDYDKEEIFGLYREINNYDESYQKIEKIVDYPDCYIICLFDLAVFNLEVAEAEVVS